MKCGVTACSNRLPPVHVTFFSFFSPALSFPSDSEGEERVRRLLPACMHLFLQSQPSHIRIPSLHSVSDDAQPITTKPSYSSRAAVNFAHLISVPCQIAATRSLSLYAHMPPNISSCHINKTNDSLSSTRRVSSQCFLL